MCVNYELPDLGRRLLRRVDRIVRRFVVPSDFLYPNAPKPELAFLPYRPCDSA